MKNLLPFLISIICFASYSQETEKFKKFANQIVSIKSDTIVEKYKNGQIKEVKTLTFYEYNGEQFSFVTGSYILYSKKGIVLLERTNNMFGCPIIIKAYDNKGFLFEYAETIELDTNANSLGEFIMFDTVSVITESKEYIVIKKKAVLYQEGIKVNNKKSGSWNNYKNGEIKKITEHKKRNKFDKLLPSIYK